MTMPFPHISATVAALLGLLAVLLTARVIVLRVRFNVNGTHTGPFCGIAPTGARMGVNAVAMLTFDDAGNISSSWTFADELGVLLQLGRPNLLLE